MRFSKNSLRLCVGRVTDARENDGYNEFLIASNGTISFSRMPKGKKQISRVRTVSFCDECFFVQNRILERKGDTMSYAP